jgi:hypothetical protein
MGLIKGVHLTGEDGKKYFIRDEALKLFEQSDAIDATCVRGDAVNLEAYEATQPDDVNYAGSQAATVGVE